MEFIEPVRVSLEQLKKIATSGGEYWMARDLQMPLGYIKWENFLDVIKKARMTCESTGVDADNHILQTGKMVSIGSGAQRNRLDFYVSRYGAYLIAMNGDPGLSQIAAAQSYFAVQTRRQELNDQFGSDITKRIELRERVKDAVKHLGEAAKDAGVQNYALFHEAGYRGLYSMGLTEIKQRKGLDPKENLLDRAGRAELAANEFRITQAEQIIKRDNVKGDINAREAHQKVGSAVRKTIKELGGTMPENLPAEPSIKKIAKKVKIRNLLDSKEDKEKA